MQFMFIVHADMARWHHPTTFNTVEAADYSREQLQGHYERFEDVVNETSRSGEFLGAAALSDPADARVVQWRPDHLDHSVGLDSDTAGLMLLECETWERAVAVAGRVAHPGTRIEVRRVSWASGWE